MDPPIRDFSAGRGERTHANERPRTANGTVCGVSANERRTLRTDMNGHAAEPSAKGREKDDGADDDEAGYLR
jgi:hypothetical protein